MTSPTTRLRSSVSVEWLVATPTSIHIYFIMSCCILIRHFVSGDAQHLTLWHLTHQTDLCIDLIIDAGGACASAGTTTWQSCSPLLDPTTKYMWEVAILDGAAYFSSEITCSSTRYLSFYTCDCRSVDDLLMYCCTWFLYDGC